MTSSTSAASGTQLTIEDLSTVHDALTTVAHRFLTFGSKISIPHHILAGIEKTNCDFDEKLYKVLEYRLKQLPLLTWHDIVRALRSPAVHEQVLASEIESQYIPCSSSQAQLASDQSSSPIGPDSGANSPAQAMQQQIPYHSHSHHYIHPSLSGSALQSYDNLSCFPNTIPPPAQFRPPLPQHRIHPPLHPQMHPPSPHPQMPWYPYSSSSQSFMKPKRFVVPPVTFSQCLRGRHRKRSSFEQGEVSSQTGSISAQPRSCGSHSWQSQPLMAAPPSAKRHCIQPDLLVSLPNSDNCSKASFNQFIQYVKILYRSSPLEERTEVLKLQTPGKKFINLACIDRKTEGLRTEYDEITEAMVRDGNVDVIEGRKCPIDMNEIAANLPSQAMKKVILVEGAPGVGKSTFAWEFCRRWERGEIARQYDLVLLLPLRDKKISKAECLKDLIRHHSEKVRDAVVSELESCLGVNVLFILEGYDELPDESRQSSLFLELINGQQLPFATLLITSRPWATCDVRKKFGHRIFQHIEVLGFTKEQITAYIRSALSEREALDLEECLQKQSTVRMCMYIPLNCAIVVTVYQESKANGVALPTTLSGFYVAVSCAILLRYLHATNISSEPFQNIDNLPAAVKSKFCSVCQLAYDSIAGAGDQVKLIFTDLPEDFDGLGFMDSVFELYLTQKAVASHNFLHLTFQEFLAAVHISNMEAEQRLEHFKRHTEGRLRVVLRFLAGITKLKDFNTPSSFVGLLDQPTKRGYTAIDYTIGPHVCTWVYEALRKEMIRTTFHEDITLEYVCYNYSDSAALGYCIAHSHCKWVLSYRCREEREIDILIDESQTSDIGRGVIVGLRGMIKENNTFLPLNVSLEGLHKIFTGLCIHLNELALTLPTKCSEISWPDLSSLQSLTLDMGREETMNWQLDHLLLPHIPLSLLDFDTSPSFSLEDSEAVANYISKTSTLKEVRMTARFSVTAMDKIFAALVEKESRPYFSLEISDESNMDNNDAEKFANYIRTTALSKLMFPDLEFSAFGALQVARALREVPDLIADKLYFCICGPSDFVHAIQLIEYFDLIDETMFQEIEGNKVIFSFLLPDSTTVEWRFFVGGGIDDVGLQHMAEALCNKPSIKALTLIDFKVSNVGAKALAGALNSNNILEELNLSGTEIGIVGTEVLAQAIGSNTTLKKLSIYDNDVGDDGAKALAELLNCNTSLEELDLSWNKIGSVGTEALAQANGPNKTLKKLSLYGNDVGDAGAKALAEVLNCNTVLEELDLSCNEIGDVGAEALAQTVGSNTALKNLDLYNNDVGDVGAIALAQALHSNSSLEVLNLQWNCIGDSGAKAFAKALHHNSTITHLDLSDNRDIGKEGVHHLIQALTVNDSISENGLTLDRKGSECVSNCLRYRNVEHKIQWW